MHSLLSLHYMHYGQVCRFAGSTHTGYLGLCMRGRQGSRKGGRGKYTSRACLLGEELEDRLVQDVPVFSLTRSSSDLSQFPACDRGWVQTLAVLLFKGNGQTTPEAPCVKAALRGHCTDNDDDDDDDADYCDDDDDGKECTAAMRYEGRDDPAKIGCEE